VAAAVQAALSPQAIAIVLALAVLAAALFIIHQRIKTLKEEGL
jgi:hypothetical protein